MMDIFIAFLLAWICTFTGVALGGWLVYRTKREVHEGLFQTREPVGESFNLDDGFDEDEPFPSKVTIPQPVATANDAFVQQFAETLADQAGEK